MAGEYLVVNPPRHRRRKKATKKRVRRHRVRRNEPNPRRRRYARRHNARRHVRRHRVRRNPRMPFGINFPQIAGVAGSVIVTDIGAGFLQKVLPDDWKATGKHAALGRIGAKAVIGIVAPLLLKRMLPRGIGTVLALGGGVAVVIDLFKTYAAPAMNLQMGAYEYAGELAAYEQEGLEALPETEASLTGFGDVGDSAYGGGAY